MKKGYIQIYTGDGKGKTTASIGLAVRSVGAGMHVLISQFVKAIDTAELNILKNVDNITLKRYATSKKFSWDMDDDEKMQLTEEMKKQLHDTNECAQSGEYDLIVFDELLGAYHGGYITKNELLNLVANKPENCEYIITGRGAPDWLVEKADLVSSIEPVKHYMDAGIMARKGIEF